jgi:hypothetical protein
LLYLILPSSPYILFYLLLFIIDFFILFPYNIIFLLSVGLLGWLSDRLQIALGLGLLIVLRFLLGLSVIPPMLFELCQATCMRFVVIASEGLVAVDTDERSWSATTECMSFSLFFLESNITVRADEGDHQC